VKGAFEAMMAGKLNVSVECSPLLGPQLMQAVKDLKAGKTLPRRIVTEEAMFTAANAREAIRAQVLSGGRKRRAACPRHQSALSRRAGARRRRAVPARRRGARAAGPERRGQVLTDPRAHRRLHHARERSRSTAAIRPESPRAQHRDQHGLPGGHLCPNLSVAENIAAGVIRGAAGWRRRHPLGP
jgi:hypothetical protein